MTDTTSAPSEDAPDLAGISDDMAVAARGFVTAVQDVAAGEQPAETVSVLLLELSALLVAGATLGAIVDVVPEERFEPDAGYEVDVDALRARLRELLGPADDYVEVFDPYATAELLPARLSDELADICSDLLHGLSHHLSGRVQEALWWWQFSYLSTWGPAAAGALRALQSLIAHVRLDVPIEQNLVPATDA
ncbi:MAG TPA: DUF5063 domain-containing protein [Candidatus Nanopelagicales bacterium]|nr:DUF5063 domain-containing protein [Candidatus Nanopelagicales bacterium]